VKTFQNRRKSQPGFARVLQAALLVAAACSTAVTLLASPPSWWSNGVLDPQAAADDYAAVNQGQLKNIAKQASLELDARLPGGAGTNVLSLVQGWSTPGTNTDDFAPVNLGQLKNVAKPFYDRLMVSGVTTNYPWAASTNPPNDFALANIGQVKSVFDFDLASADSDGDGIFDGWEIGYGLNPLDPADAHVDSDGDRLDNFGEYLLGTDPNVPNDGFFAEYAGSDELRAPINVNVLTTSPGNHRITWTNVEVRASKVLLQRTDDGKNWITLAFLPASNSSFNDLKAVPGRAYFYRLFSVAE
jgi:hypothetical protein